MSPKKKMSGPTFKSGVLPEAISGQLCDLKAKAESWHGLPNSARARLVRECRQRFASLEVDWAGEEMRCLGLNPAYSDAYKSFSHNPFVFISTVTEYLDRLASVLDGDGDLEKLRCLPDNGPTVYDLGEVGKVAPGVRAELWSGSNAPSKVPQVIRVTISAATGLPNIEAGAAFGNKSDPYCLCEVGGHKFQTAVVKNDLNPRWSCTQELEYDGDKPVVFTVYDKNDWHTDGEMCSAKVPNGMFKDGFDGVLELQRNGKAAGTLEVSIKVGPKGPPAEGVAVVLGTSCHSYISAIDVIHLAITGRTCVFLKHHPMRGYMFDAFAHIFEPLSKQGAFAQCVDSELDGAHAELVSHSAVVQVHLTGSRGTHEQVRAALRAAKREERVRFTSALGCLTPWIVCPGTANTGVWTEDEIETHAAVIASALKAQCSMSCYAPRVLVLPSETVWPQRHHFLAVLRKHIEELPQLPPYHPHAQERYRKFQQKFPNAQRVESPPAQPPAARLSEAKYAHLGQDITYLDTLLVEIGRLGAANCNTYAIENDAYAPVLTIATVSSSSASAFPMSAVRAVNHHLAGNLSCNVIYPDEPDDALDSMLHALNYGAIAVNSWAAYGYGNPLAVWGAAPASSSDENPQSGAGFVGNAAEVPCALKTVTLGPFSNRALCHAKATPYIVSDALAILAAQKPMAALRILWLVLKRFFGLCPKRFPIKDALGRS